MTSSVLPMSDQVLSPMPREQICRVQNNISAGQRQHATSAVQDGHFVNNITIGAPVITSLRKHSKEAFLDCHLMVSEPDKWVQVGTVRPIVSVGQTHAHATSSLFFVTSLPTLCPSPFQRG